MKKFVTGLIAIISIINTYSQNLDTAYPHIVPMTPEAAELAKYADSPVSYYSGTPSINVPLYEIDADGFKLPINLNYHASGIRADQEATWVGLGWSLDVGSRITRTVKSVDDFMLYGYDQSYKDCLNGYYDAPDIGSTLDNQYGQRMEPGVSCYYSGVMGDIVNYLKYDPEPDIFYYNIPNMSGKFILDKSRGAVLFDKSHNLKIEVVRSPGSVTFKLTDKDGNQYWYNQWEITRNYSSIGWLNKNTEALNAVYDSEASSFIQWSPFRLECETYYERSAQNPYPMATSWCLSKIITNKGNEINFTYDTETQYLPTQESSENYNYNLQTALYYYKSKVVNNALRLKTISGDFGRVEFTSSERLDIKGDSEKLDAVCIYNSINTLIKCYKFDYGYFNNDYSGNPIYAHVFKRLKLNKLTEYRSENPSISGYNTAYYANIPLNSGYKFDYFEGSFPAKNSKNVDYWGFQNGKIYGENYYIGLKINNVNYTGVKKEGDFNKAIIGTLKKITYPTGGTSEYKYEPNLISAGYFQNNTYEVPPPFTNYFAADLPVYNYYSSNPYQDIYPPSRVYTFQITNPTTLTITGNLENSRGAIDPNYYYRDPNLNPLGRIRKISPTTNTLYTYDCPHLYEFVHGSAPFGQGSEASVPIKQYALDAGTYEFTAYTPPRDVLASWRLYYETTAPSPTSNYTAAGIRISEIITDAKRRRFTYQTGMMLTQPVFYYLGRRAGIPNYIASCIVQVSESKAPLSTFNNGNIISYDWVEEYILDEEDDVATTRYNFHNNNESDRFDDNFPDSPVYINYTNGLLKSTEKFKTTGGGPKTLVEKEEYEYTSTYSNLIKAFRDRGQKRFDSDILEYYYKIERPLKTKLINTLKTDDEKSMVSETNYSYNSKDLLQSTSYSNDNIQITEKIKYPFDFNDAISNAMVSKNMIGMPIETIIIKNNIVTQAKKTEYFNNLNLGLYLPKTISNAEFNTPVSEGAYSPYYKPVLNFDSYTANGKLIETKYPDGPSIYYVWGYNEQYPIAKLENFTAADAANIQSIITTAINASNADNSTVAENALRTALTNLRNAAPNAMATTYTYDPLIGVTSITDPKGYTMYYQYDNFNRLKLVVDAAGSLVSKNEYNYKP
ncbi:hypothetical protein [Flavobacterium sp.]|uniref:hypothetical protein n=1 Tax=Flavobacterium sp. TaxID=239 RepID=UPI003D0A4E63